MAKTKKQVFAKNIACGHCGSKAPLTVEHALSQVEGFSDEESGWCWDEGPEYELLVCQSCHKVTLRQGHFHSEMPNDFEWSVLFPLVKSGPAGLPRNIAAEYEAATKVQSISPNAYAVLLGRVLEMVAEDQKATGKQLENQLDDLAVRNIIPAKLAQMAHKVRQMRNVGAHAGAGDLPASAVPALGKLCDAVLEYVYSGPALINQVEKIVARIKIEKAAKKASKAKT